MCPRFSTSYRSMTSNRSASAPRIESLEGRRLMSAVAAVTGVVDTRESAAFSQQPLEIGLAPEAIDQQIVNIVPTSELGEPGQLVLVNGSFVAVNSSHMKVGDGAYSYRRSGANTAVLTFSQTYAGQVYSIAFDLNFTSPTAGQISFDDGYGTTTTAAFTFGFAALVDGQLMVVGTDGMDVTNLSRDGADVFVKHNGETEVFQAEGVIGVGIVLGDGDDSLTIGSGVAGATVSGGEGDDTLIGGEGNDVLNGNSGRDRINAGAGNDVINGNGSRDYLTGGLGDDRIYGSDGNDVLSGLSNVDRLYGGEGDDNMAGGTSSDKLYGQAGNDTLGGGDSDDLLDGGDGEDRIDGGTGDDRMLGRDGHDSMQGATGDDSLYGNAGDDLISGGDGNDILVSIGGGSSDISVGGAGSDSFWIDSDSTETVSDLSDGEYANGALHRVDRFASVGGASTSRELLGQDLSDPLADASFQWQNFASSPLFASSGPSADDIDQGAAGDCYYLCTLSSVAGTNPQRIRQSVVDLGDGTYGVQFSRGASKIFIRIDADLPVYSFGELAYAGLGAESSTWVALMEKAFAFFRTGDGTYESIDAGWMSEAYEALGTSCKELWSAGNSTDLLEYIDAELSAGKSVTIGISAEPEGSNLVKDHAYAVISVNRDSAGNAVSLTLRNPWALDNARSTDNANDGYVTIAAVDAFEAFSTVMTAYV